MAKKSMIARELKRTKLVAKQAEKRKALKAIVRNIHSSDEERAVAQSQLNKLPRDGSPTRQRNRCAITGRPHGGLTKASW
jgi:small subunit ribosomal protein S14